jgi:hypothetical protein
MNAVLEIEASQAGEASRGPGIDVDVEEEKMS